MSLSNYFNFRFQSILKILPAINIQHDERLTVSFVPTRGTQLRRGRTWLMVSARMTLAWAGNLKTFLFRWQGFPLVMRGSPHDSIFLGTFCSSPPLSHMKRQPPLSVKHLIQNRKQTNWATPKRRCMKPALPEACDADYPGWQAQIMSRSATVRQRRWRALICCSLVTKHVLTRHHMVAVTTSKCRPLPWMDIVMSMLKRCD